MYVIKVPTGFLKIGMDSLGYNVLATVATEDKATTFDSVAECRDVLNDIGDYWAEQSTISTTEECPF